ncbi:fused uroporphyrinogen-III synthase HemD/membrane protein HemX [Cupriavidus necator]|uniref:fused uroporphyrinogen-III synthase HemD/membrane protein HemX n=1 Tax=Cupriavidus necator TaxID=106590 RepID=UPI00339D98AB
MPRPTVVVTRPAGQSRQLTEALQAAGLDVLSFPLLTIGPAADDAPLRAALTRLPEFALVVFVSPNAIAYALDALAAVQGTTVAQWPAQVPVAVVGPASVAALAERGIAPPGFSVIAPAGADTNGNGADTPHEGGHESDTPRFDSEALWAQLDPAALAGKPVLIIRGNGGRDWLGDRLREAGAQVEAVEAYRRTLPEPTSMQWQAVRDSLRPGAAPSAWLLTSSEAVRNLDALARQHLTPEDVAALRQVQCIAPHARIAEQALALGFSHIQRAAPGDAGLLAACMQWGDAHAGPAPASTPAQVVPVQGDAEVPPPAMPVAIPAPAAVPATSTKVERVTQETTSSSATPPPIAASAPGSASGSANGAGAAPRPGPGAAPRRSAALWALVAVLVVATAGGFWWLQQRVDHLTDELARRQQSNDALVQESRVLTRNAQDTVKELQAKVGALESQVGETRDKQVALEQVYQDLMRNRDDWEIAEIQQLLTNAGQQLQLTGNVQVALAALQSADARLARTDKPQYNLLRRAIARDIARMKAVPDTDLTGAAIKLDEAINQVDVLPLLSSERMLERSEASARKDAARTNGTNGANGASAPATNGNGGWFTRLWDYLREELAQVIRIRKVDDAEALLLSGDQGWFLRENVKLRLLNARLALLSRNEPVFRNDLAAAQAMIGRYFDTKSRRVQGVLTLLKQAQAGAVTVQLPTMAESLGALHALKKE